MERNFPLLMMSERMVIVFEYNCQISLAEQSINLFWKYLCNYLKTEGVCGRLNIIGLLYSLVGVNNLVTNAITGDRFNEYIGFTPTEVRQLL